MEVIFERPFFGPNNTYFRKDEVHQVPDEWKKLLPSRTKILEKDAKKPAPKPAKAEGNKEDDPKSVAKTQEDEISKIIEGKSK